MRTSDFLRRYDYVLLFMTVILVVFGVLMIASATNDAIDPELINRVPNQIQYAFIGAGLMFLLTIIDYRLLGALHTWLYLLLLGLLLAVLLFGQVGDAGARRWINLGIQVQPSEVGKILIIITLAHFLSERYDRIGRLSTVVQSIVHILPPVLLIFLQPDLGTTIVFIVLWGALLWGTGLRMQHIAMFAIVSILAMPVLWTQMEPYQRQRITDFLVEEEGEEATQGSQYNIRQAQISIGSGGLFGKGYMNGTQSQLRFLRVRHTDFIFSVIAEEFGMVGSLAVITGIGLVIMRILRGARVAADAFGSLLCYGVASLIFFQTVVSVGMNLGLLPVTGLTLPFISSGGTSLLATLAGIGLAESVIIRRRRVP